jgi:hypothetical protein
MFTVHEMNFQNQVSFLPLGVQTGAVMRSAHLDDPFVPLGLDAVTFGAQIMDLFTQVLFTDASAAEVPLSLIEKQRSCSLSIRKIGSPFRSFCVGNVGGQWG